MWIISSRIVGTTFCQIWFSVCHKTCPFWLFFYLFWAYVKLLPHHSFLTGFNSLMGWVALASNCCRVNSWVHVLQRNRRRFLIIFIYIHEVAMLPLGLLLLRANIFHYVSQIKGDFFLVLDIFQTLEILIVDL